MALEIELKAWADNPDAVRKNIETFATFQESFEKYDSYWFVPDSMKSSVSGLESGLRIRRKIDPRPDAGPPGKTAARICFKKKELRKDIEVNIEREFDVSDADVFRELLTGLGFREGISKIKRGSLWIYRGINIELSELAGLGWFCELEILSEQDDDATVEQARERLFGTLEKTGIDVSRIETRYYTEMLREAKS